MRYNTSIEADRIGQGPVESIYLSDEPRFHKRYAFKKVCKESGD